MLRGLVHRACSRDGKARQSSCVGRVLHLDCTYRSCYCFGKFEESLHQLIHNLSTGAPADQPKQSSGSFTCPTCHLRSLHKLRELLFLLSVLALLAFSFGFYWDQANNLLNSPAYIKRNLHPSRRTAFFTTMLTGKLTDVSLGIIMLLSAKNTALQTLLGVSFDRSLTAHRWIGYFFVAAVVVHTVVYIVYTAQYRSFEDLISVLFTGSNKSATHDMRWDGTRASMYSISIDCS